MEAVGSEKSQRNKIEQILSFPLKFLSTLVKSCQQESKQKLAEHNDAELENVPYHWLKSLILIYLNFPPWTVQLWKPINYPELL